MNMKKRHGTERVNYRLLVHCVVFVFNPFSTMTCFHIHSGYYLVILYSFRNSCGSLQ
ncbi:hypothetical protein E2C01_076273 [Portunus trituberculatus]|uniref:Uncharacterized protein n=1 Tax=Portunus trituberculatus TaxID=210409 RepID=A0A5B7IHF5_PORTR|nr:hypothetical protein [Portunus trituberculatus]